MSSFAVDRAIGAELPDDPDHPLIPVLGEFIDGVRDNSNTLTLLATHVKQLADALTRPADHSAAVTGVRNLAALLRVAGNIAAEPVGSSVNHVH